MKIPTKVKTYRLKILKIQTHGWALSYPRKSKKECKYFLCNGVCKITFIYWLLVHTCKSQVSKGLQKFDGNFYYIMLLHGYLFQAVHKIRSIAGYSSRAVVVCINFIVYNHFHSKWPHIFRRLRIVCNSTGVKIETKPLGYNDVIQVGVPKPRWDMQRQNKICLCVCVESVHLGTVMFSVMYVRVSICHCVCLGCHFWIAWGKKHCFLVRHWPCHDDLVTRTWPICCKDDYIPLELA